MNLEVNKMRNNTISFVEKMQILSRIPEKMRIKIS